MKNILRNLCLVFAAVCAIALIVFIIQLIVINSGNEPDEPDSIVSAPTPNQGVSQNGDGMPDGDNDGVPDQAAPINIPTVRPPPQGTRYELGVSSSDKLVIYADEELFELVVNNLDWRFEYKSGGSSALTIGIVYIMPNNVGDEAEAFLNEQTGGINAEFKGTQPIQDSPLAGYHVTAQSGVVSYEAWIHTILGSDVSISFLINYENDTQRTALYDILSSMDIE